VRQLIEMEEHDAPDSMLALAQTLDAKTAGASDAFVAELARACFGEPDSAVFATTFQRVKMAVPRLITLVRTLDGTAAPGFAERMMDSSLFPALKLVQQLPADPVAPTRPVATYRALAAALLLRSLVAEASPVDQLLTVARSTIDAANAAAANGMQDLAGRLIAVRHARVPTPRQTAVQPTDCARAARLLHADRNCARREA
jgi:hypothetical protein